MNHCFPFQEEEARKQEECGLHLGTGYHRGINPVSMPWTPPPHTHQGSKGVQGLG